IFKVTLMHKSTYPCPRQSMVWDKPMVWISGFGISMVMAGSIWNSNFRHWKLRLAIMQALKIWVNVLILKKPNYASILTKNRPRPMVRAIRQLTATYLALGVAVISMTLLIAAGLNG